MKKIMAFVLAAVMVLSLVACTTKKTDSNVLVFGTSADYAPYEFMYPDDSGKMVYGGIDVLTAQYFADYMGKTLQIENMDFGYLLTALNKGDFDLVMASLEPTDERRNAVDFSEPYIYEYPEKIVVRAADVDKYTDAATSFAGVSVAGQAGSTKPKKISDNLIDAEVVELALVPDMINQLVNGKVDACLLDYTVAMQYVKSNSDLAIADASEVYGSDPLPIACAVAKGDPKGLLPQINAAIAEMEKVNKIDEFVATADALSEVWEETSGIVPEGYTPDAG